MAAIIFEVLMITEIIHEYERAIKGALKNDDEIKGASLVTKFNLQIK